MFEQQKLKSDHKAQIDETSGRAKGLLDHAKLLVEDLKIKVDLEMKVDKEVGNTKKEADAEIAGWFRGQPLPIAQQDVDKARQQLEETAVEPYMKHIKPIQSEPLSLLSLATPALEPEEDFIVRTVFSKSEKVKTEDKKEEASLVFLSWVKTDRQETCSTQAFPNNLQQIFDTSDEEKARGLDWKKECRLLYWQEKLKEAKAKLKILTVVKTIAVHQVN